MQIVLEPVPDEMAAAPMDLGELRASLLAWYDLNRRDLPWRRTNDPYAIWVSEIMLQQTRVATVIEKYRDFLRNFPSVESLAYAAEQDVLAQWSGLGYYRRARMLHKAAKAVVQEHNGRMPATALELRSLPGIGAYTSAAIASIAFGEAVAVVDGNVERVVQRVEGWGSDSAQGRAELDRKTEAAAQAWLDPARPGDFNQSMMELGATVCLPRNPMCLVCPLRQLCRTRGEHPTPPRGKMKSQDVGYALVIRSRGRYREVLLEQRAATQTVMPGMWELPMLREAQVPGEQLRLAVRHAIMQVNYSVQVATVLQDDVESLTMPAAAPESRHWVRLQDLTTIPLTGLARKVLLRAELAEVTPERPIVEEELAAEFAGSAQ
jgi:A/G-specific adenine glycosylase